MNDLIKQVKTLDLTDGVAIIVTMPKGSQRSDVDQIGFSILEAIAPKVRNLLFIQDGMDISALNELQMREYGWVKVEAAAQRGQLVSALQKYEEAFDDLFGHCCSNGIFNAWGAIVDCSLINEAHSLAGSVLSKMKEGGAA